MHGRDNRFRPILVLKAQELNNLKLPSKEITELLTYFSEYLLSDVLLPGQVENWIMITDLTGIGVTNLPYNVIKELNLKDVERGFRFYAEQLQSETI